jgi:hypothetical protein
MNDQIKYRKGYKYQLAEDYKIQTGIIGYSIETGFLQLFLSGVLKIKSGYAWDGPSGPAIDTLNFMRGSLVHDAIYELIRKGLIAKLERKIADDLLKQICIEDGMSETRAGYAYKAVRAFASFAAESENKKEIITAPGEL